MFELKQHSGVDGLTYQFSIDNAWTPSSTIDAPNTIDMKLTTNMLKQTGFIHLKLAKEQQHLKLDKEKPASTKHYVCISGGGWRALAGAMGGFRALSNQDALRMVDMFSSVSGGSWFLSKLSFDEYFAKKVLGNHTGITNVVSEWFESEYFPAMENVNDSPQTTTDDAGVRSFVSTITLHLPDQISAWLGDAVLAADRFDFS